MTKETYVAEIKCHNCKFEYTWVGIPFGTPIDSHLYEEECVHCGFYIIRRKKKQ